MGEARRKREAAARAQARDARGVPEQDGLLGCLPPARSVDDAIPEVARSLAELDEHMAACGQEQYGVVARHKLQAVGRVQVQLWESEARGNLLWDSIDVAVSGNAEREDLLARLQSEGLIDAALPADRLINVADTRNECALFEMHPQRFSVLHPMGAFVRQFDAAPPFTHRAMEAFAEEFRRSTNARMNQERLRLKRKANNRQLHQVISLATFFHDFQRHGRNIFRFPSRLIDLFHRTDVDGIPLQELKLPYDGFYMYFGRQERFAVDGWAPDGAYVSQIGGPGQRVIQFAMTFAPDTSIIYDHYAEYPEPVYIQALNEEHLNIGVGEAVDLVYSEKVAELKRQIAEGISPEALAQAQQNAPPGVRIEDGTKKNAAAELSFIGGRHEEWHHVLRLVVNGLAYLSAYPADRDRQYPNAPADLVHDADAGPAGPAVAAASAQHKLARLGYSAVHICGAKGGVARVAKAGPDHSPDDVTELGDFTWVRGHWRRQPHGPGRTLRKLRWLMPFKRYLNRPASEQHGHIYMVDEGDDASWGADPDAIH